MDDATTDAAGRPTFALRRSRWAWPFVALFAPGRHVVTVGDGSISVRVGALGNAVIPIARVTRVSSMHWPWWGGVGVRIGKGLVAFVPASGDSVVVELDGKIRVRAPLGWDTARIVLAVDQVERFAAAVDREKRRLADEAAAAAEDPAPDDAAGPEG